jgi:transposase
MTLPAQLYTWCDNKVRELVSVKLLHTSLLNITVVAFKVLPLGRNAPMPAPSPPFKTILELILWNGLQSCRRRNIEFLVKLGKSGSEIREMLVQVYGDNSMKKTAVYRWVIRFSEERERVTDEERSERPATSRTEENIAKVHQIMCKNRRLTVRNIAEQANIYRKIVRTFLTEELDTKKLCEKVVPKDLLTRHCL